MQKVNINDLNDDQITQVFREAVHQAIENARQKGLPISQYDTEKMLPYILYPDGHWEYPDTDILEGKGNEK